MAILPFVAGIAIRLEKELDRVYDAISEENAVMNTVAQENLAGVRTVKSFAREPYEIKKIPETPPPDGKAPHLPLRHLKRPYVPYFGKGSLPCPDGSHLIKESLLLFKRDAIWLDFPPGAAHRSNTFSPGFGFKNSTTDMALGSWI